MAKTGKSLHELIEEVYLITGTFCFERNDLHITESKKENVLKNCKDGLYKEFGKYKIQRVDNLDGYKFFFDENLWNF